MHVVKSKGQLGILRQNIDLTQFVIEGDFTGRQLGKGFFGSVEEVRNIKYHFNATSLQNVCILLLTNQTDHYQRSYMCWENDQAIRRS